jgi:hypothetical protein
MCESKSGGNVEEEQARRYATVNAQDLRLAGAVDLPTRTPPTVETLYLCLSEHAGRVQQGLGASGVSFPLLAVSARSATLLFTERASPLLARALDGPLVLPAGIPRHIPLDDQSSVSELRGAVRAELAVLQSHSKTEQTIRAITERVVPHWPIYGRAARERFVGKVTTAVREIVQDEPDTFAYQPDSGSTHALVRVLRTPEDNDPRGRAQAWQATGRRRHPAPRLDPNPDQLDLLNELDTAEDLADDEAESEGSP